MNGSNVLWVRAQAFLTAAAGVIGYFVGGWDKMLTALTICMAIDYITGVMCAILDRKLSSGAGFKGICKKVLILMMVGIANIIDVNVIGTGSMLRSAVICFYISNEGVSLLENAAHMGLPVPEKLKDILAQLHKKSGENAKHPDDGGEDPQSEGK